MSNRTLFSFPIPFWVLFAGTLVNRFGSFVFVFIVLYLTSKGYSAVEAGTSVSIYGAGSVLAALLGGFLTDRIGRRATIALSMFSSAIILFLFPFASQLPIILALSGLAGLMAELYRPASSALIADLVPSENRVKAYAWYRLAINAGTAAGAAVAGLLSTQSFTSLFILDGLSSFIFGILALLALPTITNAIQPQSSSTTQSDNQSSSQPASSSTSQPASSSIPQSASPLTPQPGLFHTLIRDIPFQLYWLAFVFIAFIYFQGISTLPLQVQSQGLPNSDYGFLMSLNGLIVVFLELPINLYIQRFPKGIIIALGMTLLGLGFGLTAYAPALGLNISIPALYPLALTVLVWTLGEIVYSAAASAYLADISPSHLRGRYQGLFGLSWSLGFIIGPLLGTYLFSLNPALLWLLCALLGLLGATLVLISIRLLKTHPKSPSLT